MQDRDAFRSTAALSAVVVVIALLVLVIQDPGRLKALTNFSGASSSPDAGRSGPAEPGAPAPAAKPEVDPAQPFAGSPAESWPAGIAGLALPPARATGEFSAKEVAGALTRARRYVAAKRLDPRVIGGANPAAFIGLMDPRSDLRRDLIAGLKNPSRELNPADTVTRFDPDGTRLHGPVVKLKGTATVTSRGPDELVVALDYSVVYAVAKRGTAPVEVDRVLVREQAELSTFHDHDVTPGKVWVTSSTSDVANVHCDSADGFLHPSYQSDLLDRGPNPTGAPEDPYDTTRPVGAGDDCGTITRV